MSLSEIEAKRLKELLISWELEELFDLLKDEEISTKILQIMKRRHLHELLRNQKLGVRIRFEHHFEQWRQLIRKPLEEETVSSCLGDIGQIISLLKKEETIQIATTENQQTNIVTTPALTPVAPITKPQITLPKRITLPEASLLIKQNSNNCNTLSEESLLVKPNSNVAVEEVAAPTTAAAPTPNKPYKKYQHVNIEKQAKDPNITVLKILNESGHKGESLLQAYEEQQTLTPLQRSLLITLIATYFETKNYHLSMGTSQILENQIVDLFPTEKVESFRGKKSKIYMKFNNVKRRDTDFFPTKKRARGANIINAAQAEAEAENSTSDLEMITNASSEKDEQQMNDYLIKSEYFSD